MTLIADRSTLALPAPGPMPPVWLRSASHNAIQVRYQNGLPAGGHPAPRKGDIQRCCWHRGTGTVATGHAGANQMPIAPRR
jgi:hypothetical protein